MRAVGAVDGVGAWMPLAFLADALEDALGARALDVDSDTRIFRLEGLSEGFGDLHVHGGVEDDLPFLLRRGDHSCVTWVGGGAARCRSRASDER